jgi:hypothetical protein
MIEHVPMTLQNRMGNRSGTKIFDEGDKLIF